MRKKFILFWVIQSCVLSGFGQDIQTLQPAGGGKYEIAPRDDISPEQRSRIILMLQRNTQDLRQRGILQSRITNKVDLTGLQWPLKQAAGFNDNGYYGISNYVDQNSVIPNLVQDYSCATRSYDGHRGTDMFPFPFPFTKMATNAVEIVAAVSGVIIGKSDGNFDQNCALCPGCFWNAVYVRHADGSEAWYGHMKTGTLTSKSIGQSVVTGEYLGIVGSSGNSSGPHLHFELWTDNTYNQLIDPWAGTCNILTGNVSGWASQEDYRMPTPLKLMTHGILPGLFNCPGGEAMNLKTIFLPGDIIHFSSYYRDNMNGETAVHRVYMPDNSLWHTWNQTFFNTFDASSWWYTWTLPSSGSINGVWRYEITYNNQTITTNFSVNTALPLTLVSFTWREKEEKAELLWETEDEINVDRFIVERSNDGLSFDENLAALAAKNSLGKNNYAAIDERPVRGSNYYRLKIIDRDGSYKYSSIVKIDFNDALLQVHISPVPFRDELTIRISGEFNKLKVSIHSISGQLIRSQAVLKTAGNTIILRTVNLNAGIYFITIEENGQVIERRKVVKSN